MFIKKILCFTDKFCYICSVFQNHFARDAPIILVQSMLRFFSREIVVLCAKHRIRLKHTAVEGIQNGGERNTLRIHSLVRGEIRSPDRAGFLV